MAFFSKSKTVWSSTSSKYDDNFVQMMMALDFNGDGRLDLVAARLLNPIENSSLPLQVFQQGRDGTFVDKAGSVVSGPTARNTHPREMLKADFNGDGKDDIFVADHGYDSNPFPGAQNTLLLSSGKGFVNATATNLPQETDYSHSAATGDIDGDSDIDIIVGNFWGGNSGNPDPYLLVNNGTGVFTKSTALPTVQTDFFTACEIGDLDRDGDNDIFMGGADSTASQIWLNNGSGSFTKASWTIPEKILGAGASVYDVHARDINGDGNNDVLVLVQGPGGTGRALQVLMNKGAGVFEDESAARLDYSLPGKKWAEFFEFADFNGDGADDIMVTGNFDPKADILLNNGDGIYFRPKDFQQTFGYQTEIGDFNGDGKPDVISWTSTNTMILRTFDKGPTYSLNGTDKSDKLYGDARGNKMDAGNGNDKVYSGAGNDRVLGGSGNDTILAGSGNDTINGGSGTDTIVYTGNRSDYDIVAITNGFTITDNRATPLDGVDTVLFSESFQFADGTVSADLLI